MKIESKSARNIFSGFGFLFSVFFSLSANAIYVDLGIGTNLSVFAYKEDLIPPAKSTETAYYPTLLADLKAHWGANSFLELKYDGISGVRSQYDGSSLDDNTPVLAVNKLGFTETELNIRLGITDRFAIFTGTGKHVWNRFLAGNPGYREIYSWNYTPIGVAVKVLSNPTSEVSIELSQRLMSAGKIKVITSETIPDGVDSEMNLGSKPTNRFAVVWQNRWSQFTTQINPWFETSAIGESNVVTNTTLAPNSGEGIYEPSSKTNRYGVELLFVFTFGSK